MLLHGPGALARTCILPAWMHHTSTHKQPSPSPRPLPGRSYLLAYNSHHLKDTFNVHSLDLKAVARSFGFSSPPRVNINLESKAANTRKAQKGGQGADYRRMKTGGWGGWLGGCRMHGWLVRVAVMQLWRQ